jgi:hypothetical protein
VILIIQNVVLLAAHRLIKSVGWKALPAARHVVDHFPKVFIFICFLDVDENKSWFSNGRNHPSDSGELGFVK